MDIGNFVVKKSPIHTVIRLMLLPDECLSFHFKIALSRNCHKASQDKRLNG